MSRHTDKGLDQLDAALMAPPEKNHPRMLNEFDHFCAGLITCAEGIPPSVWWREIWGQEGYPEFEQLGEMQTVLNLEIIAVV